MVMSMHNHLVPSKTKHPNLIQAICKLVSIIPITLVFQEVKGHQDRIRAFDTLDCPSQLNIYADNDAK
jgi:hypothetical protein